MVEQEIRNMKLFNKNTLIVCRKVITAVIGFISFCVAVFAASCANSDGYIGDVAAAITLIAVILGYLMYILYGYEEN